MEQKVSDYYTPRGYQKLAHSGGGLTSALEDYLEMICRLIRLQGYIRVNELASNLHVKPSSATKMLLKLSELGYVDYRRYGVIRLTQKGEVTGGYLLKRHDTIREFFDILNPDNSEAFMEAELAEHILSEESVESLAKLNAFLKEQGYPDISKKQPP